MLYVDMIDRCCPYYFTRAAAKETADIIFMPYNYLLDPMVSGISQLSGYYSGIQCNHRHCYFKIITLNEPNPLAYHDL